jgi:hypothetical protein
VSGEQSAEVVMCASSLSVCSDGPTPDQTLLDFPEDCIPLLPVPRTFSQLDVEHEHGPTYVCEAPDHIRVRITSIKGPTCF